MDEASSVSWGLLLLTRWEGIDWGINVIQQRLWPLLQEWSTGVGTDIGAAGAIDSIGLIGQRLPPSKRDTVNSIVDVLNSLLTQSEQGKCSSAQGVGSMERGSQTRLYSLFSIFNRPRCFHKCHSPPEPSTGIAAENHRGTEELETASTSIRSFSKSARRFHQSNKITPCAVFEN